MRNPSLALITATALFSSLLSCSGTASKDPSRFQHSNRAEAVSAWQAAMETAQSAKDDTSLLNRRFISEGPHKELLEDYELSLSKQEEALTEALQQAQTVVPFGGDQKFEPLSTSLLSYMELVGKARYAGERYQGAGFLLQVANMKRKVEQVCRSNPGAEREVAVCHKLAGG